MSSSIPGASRAPDAPARRGRLVLLVLFAVFFVPIVLAYALNVLAPDWRPFGATNRGELVQPARAVADVQLSSLDGEPLPVAPFAEKWTLVVLREGGCADRCATALERMRQGRLAMGRHAERVQRYLVVTGEGYPSDARGMLAEHPGLRLVGAPASWLTTLRDASEADPQGTVYLIDPQGYLILRYPAELSDDALLKDLKRLLRVSKIG